MLSLAELKKYYIHLYTELRNYLWDFNTVECLAELEVSVYQRFPDIQEIKRRFNNLEYCISTVCHEDEYLDSVVSDFRNIIYSIDQFYSKITSFREV